MLRSLREWARDLVPIDAPDHRELKIKGVIDDFGYSPLAGEVHIPLLFKPDPTDDLSRVVVDGITQDLALEDHARIRSDGFELLLAPNTIDLQRIPSFVVPETISLLDKIDFPRRAGKSYARSEEAEEGERAPVQTELPSLDRSKCKHGLPRYMCDICQEEKRQRNKKARVSLPGEQRPKQIDVFELLLPYLCPPVEPLLDNPVLFPPDRRPYDYQVYGIRFLLQRNSALLGDQMGLGKTIQAIVAMQILLRRREIYQVLILCPLSVLGNWEREIYKWAPEIPVLKVRGDRDAREHLWNSPGVVFLTTYETYRADSGRNLIQGAKFELVVLDEVQRIKNFGTKTSRSVRRLGPEYRWGLSGTPLENKVEDVVSIFHFLKPDLFRRDGFQYSPGQVRKKIEPFFLRRRTEDVRKELPKKKVSEVWLELTPAQAAAYDEVLQEARERLSRPDASRIHVFAQISRLKQICNVDAATGSSCKADYLLDQIETISENGEKALVFSQFPNKSLPLVQERLQEFGAVIFHGGLSHNQRERLLVSFEEEDDPRFLLLSVKAGGVGLNLTTANHVFHFDHWWNPAVTRQAEARAHRIGQEKTVFVHELFTIGTIEERIRAILEHKQQLFDDVIDELTMEKELGTLTDNDLFGLFDLAPPGGVDGQQETSGIDLSSLDGYEFEDLVADLYRKMGFKVEVSSRSDDAGIDLVARRVSDVGEDQVIIQCKHYLDSQVGVGLVRDFLGAWKDQARANRAILVTSGKFSEKAVDLARRQRIDLVDGVYLGQLLNRYMAE